MRIGFGYDSHRFSDDPMRPLILGGIHIPNTPGLAGHSDADVLTHALIDALLGAIAHGDIGSHFPDTDPQWEGADSIVLLTTVLNEIHAAGFQLGNADITLICEKPKIRPFVDDIRKQLASTLKTDINNISVKGKTNEKMDDIGAGLGIVAYCVVLLETIH